MSKAYEDFMRKYNELKAKAKYEELTPEEEEQLDFMQQKLDDWASDIEYSY